MNLPTLWRPPDPDFLLLDREEKFLEHKQYFEISHLQLSATLEIVNRCVEKVVAQLISTQPPLQNLILFQKRIMQIRRVKNVAYKLIFEQMRHLENKDLPNPKDDSLFVTLQDQQFLKRLGITY